MFERTREYLWNTHVLAHLFAAIRMAFEGILDQIIPFFFVYFCDTLLVLGKFTGYYGQKNIAPLVRDGANTKIICYTKFV